MATIRDALLCVFLCVLCASVVKVFFLLDHLQVVIEQVEGAAREQRSYYKATGKALAITTIRLGRLVESTDTRLERLTASTEHTLQAARESLAEVSSGSRDLLATAGAELEAEGQASRETLRASSEALRALNANLEEMRALWPPLNRTAVSAAEATHNVAEATHSVDVALQPLRKPAGRWKRLLGFLLGMIKINLR